MHTGEKSAPGQGRLRGTFFFRATGCKRFLAGFPAADTIGLSRKVIKGQLRSRETFTLELNFKALRPHP